MPIAECGLKKKTTKIRNPQSEMTEPMPFGHQALAPGPQPRLSGKIKLCESSCRAGIYRRKLLLGLWFPSHAHPLLKMAAPQTGDFFCLAIGPWVS
jgi:hypothetical protein